MFLSFTIISQNKLFDFLNIITQPQFYMIYQILGFSSDKSTRFRRDYTHPHFQTSELKEMISPDLEISIIEKEDCKVIYEKYSTLCIMFVTDLEENEFFILEIIRKFLNLLDCYFKNVRDNHLVYNFDIVHEILDEYVLNGKVVENVSEEIMKVLKE